MLSIEIILRVRLKNIEEEIITFEVMCEYGENLALLHPHLPDVWSKWCLIL